MKKEGVTQTLGFENHLWVLTLFTEKYYVSNKKLINIDDENKFTDYLNNFFRFVTHSTKKRQLI